VTKTNRKQVLQKLKTTQKERKIQQMDGWSSVLRPRQHSIGYMGDGFYRSKDPTNSTKVLKEQIQYINTEKYTNAHNKSPGLQ